jgi:hypothetical protein
LAFNVHRSTFGGFTLRVRPSPFTGRLAQSGHR